MIVKSFAKLSENSKIMSTRFGASLRLLEQIISEEVLGDHVAEPGLEGLLALFERRLETNLRFGVQVNDDFCLDGSK